KRISSKEDGMSKFWSTPGMDTFVDWVTDPDNHARLYAHQPLAGNRPIDIHKEIAELVNKKHGTTWDTVAVKSKIAYSRKKYDAARRLAEATGVGDTDETTLRDAMLEKCPFYDRFHAVFAESLKRNPPVQKQPPVPKAQDEPSLAVDNFLENNDIVDDMDDSVSDSDFSFRKCWFSSN
ncbi:hypothetical protein BGZ98_006763, partial [Dissophora globulifera]